MIERLNGIVLRTVKYSDNEMIVDMFTDKRGRCAFSVRVARKSRSLSTVSLWRPLSMVEFDCDFRPNRTVHNLKSPRALVSSSGLDDFVKSCQALFMAEVLYHALRNEPENRPLYDFVAASVQWLDLAEDRYANFHIVFMVRLMRFIGIFPNMESYAPSTWFDMMEACFTKWPPSHAHGIAPEEAIVLPLLARLQYSSMHVLKWNRLQRGRCLKLLNDYYRLHIPSFPELKSLEVLTGMFD